MPTAVEQIRTKIAELEARIGGLRIAERELQALERVSSREGKKAPAPKAKQKPGPKAKAKPKSAAVKSNGRQVAREQAGSRQTIGGAITEVLVQHGSLHAAEIAERIKASGREINNRTVSFALQALKKRGLAKNTDGKWSAAKGRG